MAGQSTITVDLARGEVVLGGCRIRLAAERDAAGLVPTRFRLEDGAIVRAITFGERSRLVRDALTDESPARALVDLLRAAAHEGPSSLVADAVLLAMAGGGEPAPEFDRCAVEASRLNQWSWLSVHDAPAIVVDRAVVGRGPRSGPAVDPTGEWNRFVFPGSDARELDALLDDMVAALLARGVPVAAHQRISARTGATPESDTQPLPAAASVAATPQVQQANAPRHEPAHVGAADVGAAFRRPAGSTPADAEFAFRPPDVGATFRRPEDSTPAEWTPAGTASIRWGRLASPAVPDTASAPEEAAALAAAPESALAPGFTPARTSGSPIGRALAVAAVAVSRAARPQAAVPDPLSVQTFPLTPADSAALAAAGPFEASGVSGALARAALAIAGPTTSERHAQVLTAPQPLLAGGSTIEEVARALAAECDVRGLDA